MWLGMKMLSRGSRSPLLWEPVHNCLSKLLVSSPPTVISERSLVTLLRLGVHLMSYHSAALHSLQHLMDLPEGTFKLYSNRVAAGLATIVQCNCGSIEEEESWTILCTLLQVCRGT